MAESKIKKDFVGIGIVIAGAVVMFFLVIIVPFVILPNNQLQALAAVTSPTFESTWTSEPLIATATKIVYRPITWAQLESFLKKDPTNLNKYAPDYVCMNFAEDLVENATNEDIQAWIVGIQLYAPEDHAIAAFKTTDRGTVYIEPQDDNPFIKPTIGQPLCEEGTGKKCLGTVVSFLIVDCEDHWRNCTARFDHSPKITHMATPVTTP